MAGLAQCSHPHSTPGYLANGFCCGDAIEEQRLNQLLSRLAMDSTVFGAFTQGRPINAPTVIGDGYDDLLLFELGR